MPYPQRLKENGELSGAVDKSAVGEGWELKLILRLILTWLTPTW